MRLLLLPLLLLASVPARAQQRAIVLAPPSAEVSFRSYGFGGIVPVDSKFAEFDGTLTFDPANHQRCEATLTANVASLRASTTAIQNMIAGPEFLDAAQFPTLRFVGRCDATGLDGTLTMRGVTRPLHLELTWEARRLIAQGDLHRADWGMTAKPFLVGGTARIRVVTTLP